MIGIAGAGAFGTALAVSLARDERPVTLWARNEDAAQKMQSTRQNSRLPGVTLPDALLATGDLQRLFACDTLLLAIPAQTLRGFLTDNAGALADKYLVACCKGIDLETLTGPSALVRDIVPSATPAMLTGPSFADDIARGLPTGLTLACGDEAAGKMLQQWLSTANLRLYTTTDVIGAELGGALKNVVAIGCGVAIGAGLGDSARAALLTRGFSEMQRIADHLGADPSTLTGLSGLGDLALTCTSDLSRNYRFGLALGAGKSFDSGTTVEGAATARAVTKLARDLGLDLPVTAIVAKLAHHEIDPQTALQTLLARPLKEE